MAPRQIFKEHGRVPRDAYDTTFLLGECSDFVESLSWTIDNVIASL